MTPVLSKLTSMCHPTFFCTIAVPAASVIVTKIIILAYRAPPHALQKTKDSVDAPNQSLNFLIVTLLINTCSSLLANSHGRRILATRAGTRR
jgi:hypothetical protein